MKLDNIAAKIGGCHGNTTSQHIQYLYICQVTIRIHLSTIHTHSETHTHTDAHKHTLHLFIDHFFAGVLDRIQEDERARKKIYPSLSEEEEEEEEGWSVLTISC